MRVIAGTRRSLPLRTVKDDRIRPTTDRVKETLFNMLSPYVPGCRFLDLFAGSGAIGIEALSRGAEEAVFVDASRDAVSVIRENLRFTKLSESATVLEDDVTRAIRRLEAGQKCFGIIFMDPPYGQGLQLRTLEALKGSPLVDDKTLIVAEALKDTDFRPAEDMGYLIVREKFYGSNKHVWLRRAE
ncbi:MAG: 16S rRNA (guanine(966)-N(2))-methyltransferase RsmD [Lachnospiraceae bacterium]|nr:16S rRNA (guanine(966)-N(2))-methyltransferase RsmD [Lachnospiraceae bacterium]MBR5338576.1 16S rRNA (guanine(966)-N(2))-methyltransferase RsmD [Lachnospiraceae bacterium]